MTSFLRNLQILENSHQREIPRDADSLKPRLQGKIGVDDRLPSKVISLRHGSFVLSPEFGKNNVQIIFIREKLRQLIVFAVFQEKVVINGEGFVVNMKTFRGKGDLQRSKCDAAVGRPAFSHIII